MLGVHDLMVHDYGPGRCFASVHVEMDAKNDILKSHDICDNIERDFQGEGVNLVVHLDPIITDDEETNELKKMTAKLLASMDYGITMHDFRVVKGYTHTNLIFDVVVPFDCKLSDDELKTEHPANGAAAKRKALHRHQHRPQLHRIRRLLEPYRLDGQFPERNESYGKR